MEPGDRVGEFEVYNFEFENFHTYFVSDLEILVHNACDFPDPPDLPEGKLSRVSEKWLKQKNINAHEIKGDVPGGTSEFDISKDKNGNL